MADNCSNVHITSTEFAQTNVHLAFIADDVSMAIHLQNLESLSQSLLKLQFFLDIFLLIVSS